MKGPKGPILPKGYQTILWTKWKTNTIEQIDIHNNNSASEYLNKSRKRMSNNCEKNDEHPAFSIKINVTKRIRVFHCRLFEYPFVLTRPLTQLHATRTSIVFYLLKKKFLFCQRIHQNCNSNVRDWWLKVSILIKCDESPAKKSEKRKETKKWNRNDLKCHTQNCLTVKDYNWCSASFFLSFAVK